MASKWIRLSRVVPVALALSLWGCDDSSRDLQRLVGPSMDVAHNQSSNGKGFRRIKGDGETGTVSAILDSKGGKISFGAHELFVPRGTVSAPTLFSVEIEDGGFIQVNLTATRLIDGHDVGEDGFTTAVRLRLSYATADNVGDPSRLVIVRVGPDNTVEPRPSKVDLQDQHVTATLDRFSRYAVGVN